EVDGHNIKSLTKCFNAVPFKKGRPSVVISHTIKGKGVSFMQDRLEWHYKSPNSDQLALAMKELGIK
ncbi:MAG: transketolase, partial [Candidatus Omnitrophica bacterium CG02_land_8_20_14_3_00__42_8]